MQAPPPESFTGDPKVHAEQFWRQVRLYFRNTEEKAKCDDFELVLAADSAADRWYQALSDEVKQDWKKLEKAFAERWFKGVTPKLSDAEALEQIERTLPNLQDLSERDRIGDGAQFRSRHVIWVQTLHNTAVTEGYSQGLAEQVRSKLPRVLRKLVDPVASWDELRDRVIKVNAARLREAAKDALQDNTKTEKLLRRLDEIEGKKKDENSRANSANASAGMDELSQRMAALSMQAAYHPVSPLPYYTPPAYPQWTPPPPPPPVRQHPPPPPPPFQVPYQPPAVAQARAPGTVARGLPIAERHARLVQNAKPAPPDSEAARVEHARLIAEWHTANPTAHQADENHPYPLTPGTQPVGSEECYTCGGSHPRAGGCGQRPPVPAFEQKWRAIAGFITRTYNQGQGPATAVHQVAIEQQAQQWYPAPQYPASHPPYPAYMQAYPPHMSQYSAPQTYYAQAPGWAPNAYGHQQGPGNA